MHCEVHRAGFDCYGNVFAFDPGKMCLLEILDLSEREVDLNAGEVRRKDMSWGREKRMNEAKVISEEIMVDNFLKLSKMSSYRFKKPFKS